MSTAWGTAGSLGVSAAGRETRDTASRASVVQTVTRCPRRASVRVLNTLPRGLVQSDLRHLYGAPDRVTPELVDRHFELRLRQGNRRALGQVLQQDRHDDAAGIQQVKQPALILWGGRDRWLAPEHGERFGRDIRGAKLLRFEALGHMPHEEDAAGTLAALREFLSRP